MEHQDKHHGKTKDLYWQEFLRTGSVKAYLDYKRQSAPKE